MLAKIGHTKKQQKYLDFCRQRNKVQIEIRKASMMLDERIFSEAKYNLKCFGGILNLKSLDIV